MQNFSPIKKRIVFYIERKHISRRQFYKETSISRGTLENDSGISEESLTKLFTTYHELSPLWIITGEGDMLRETDSSEGKKEESDRKGVSNMTNSDEKEQIIKELKEIIHAQSRFIKIILDKSDSDNTQDRSNEV